LNQTQTIPGRIRNDRKKKGKMGDSNEKRRAEEDLTDLQSLGGQACNFGSAGKKVAKYLRKKEVLGGAVRQQETRNTIVQ